MPASRERVASAGSGGARSWLAAVLESTTDAVVGATVEGRISSVNPAACRTFGYSPAEFLNLSVPDITLPRRADAVAEVLARLEHGERLDHYRTTLVRKGGETFPASIALSPVLDDAGGVAGVAAIIRDLSAEKDAEEKRRLLEGLVESSPDAIYSRSLRGTVTSWNPAAEDLFGYRSDEIVGRSILLLVPPEGESEVGAFTDRIVRGEVVREYETIRLTKDRRRIPLALTLFPIRDETGTITGLGALARDLLRTAAMQASFRRLESLSERERDVAGLLADGMNNKDIARALGLSEQTVKNYVSRVLLKLGKATRTQAAADYLAFRPLLGSPSLPHGPRRA